ncbi:MAG: sulfotransferase, partial [Acidobacteriaceae bacterium]
HLKRHPEVFLPSFKELRMFQPEHPDSLSPARYRNLYAEAKDYKAIGEVTPYYLVDPAVPGRIREVSPAARIVILLRDPVERAYAHYLTVKEVNVGTGYREPSGSFAEALRMYDKTPAEQRRNLVMDYLEQGLYSAGVRRYLETFGSDQVLVLLFDDLAKDTKGVFERIAQHIGVDPDVFSNVDASENRNPYRVPKYAAIRWGQKMGLSGLLPHSLKVAMLPLFFKLRKTPLDDESRRRLQQFYDRDITELEALLGRKLPELRKSWI